MILTGLAIALGVVIDDAIVDVENIARRLRQQHLRDSVNRPHRAVATLILEAALEMRSSLIFATLIILLAVAPLFFMQGLSGAFFEPLAISYVLALLTSLAVSLLVTPVLSLVFLTNGQNRAGRERGESPLVRGLQRIYNGILEPAIRAPYLALIIAGVIIVAGLAVLPLLGQSMLPSFKQTELLIEWDGAPGTSRSEMNRITAKVSEELRSIPGVRNVGSHVGRAVTGDAVVGINSGEVWVSLDPAADYEATVSAIQEVIDGYPGLLRTVQTYQPERTSEALTRADQDIVVRVYGHELEVMREKALEVSQALVGINGVVDVRADRPTEEPQVEIEVDLAAAEAHGIKPGDVRRQATTLLSGLQVGNLFEEQKVFDVVVWGVPEIRNSLTQIQELLIDTPSGQVQLGEVAEVRIAPAPIIIKRDAVSRFIDVGANVRGRSLSSVAADIKGQLQAIEFPLEYRAEVLGESVERQAAQQRMIGILVAAVIGIFLLLQAAFGSWRLAFVTLLTLPAALAGGVLAAFAGGGVLSLGSLFGFLTVLGIAVRNNIVMTHHFHHLELYEGEMFGPQLVLRGARERLAPLLTTALATGAALLPLLFFGDVAGHEIVRPMAIVILGGLCTATLLNLFVVPALYLRFGSSPEVDKVSLPFGEQPGLTASAD
jgi:Cu/Ag efflux pump CusA